MTIELDGTGLRVYDERGDTLINQISRTSGTAFARVNAYGDNRNR